MVTGSEHGDKHHSPTPCLELSSLKQAALHLDIGLPIWLILKHSHTASRSSLLQHEPLAQLKAKIRDNDALIREFVLPADANLLDHSNTQ